MKYKLSSILMSVMVLLLQFISTSSVAQLTWPSGQLLPTFPATAQKQDLIYLNGSSVPYEVSWRWEAEGPSIGHGTGRLETDGWLCQTGVDAPNAHMVYGPYDTRVTAGPNTAEFRMKIDNNTINNDPVVDIDVRNATTGVTLASQTVTRQQFTVASNYTSFRLPFIMPADNQSIELRVYWRGTSYIKVDYVGVQQNNFDAELYLFSSLKGIVNRTQPRIFSYEGDAFAEGPYTWMQSLGLTWTEHTDKWPLITKYRSEINGLIVYDPAQIHSVNLATVLAKDRKALIASPSLVARLTSAPYNLPILLDLRGQFSSKLQVYQTLYNTYWPNLDKRLLIGINPEAHKAAVREYTVAVGTAAIWLDPKVSGESELLNNFLSSMPAGANYMGWWPEEEPGVSRASQYGIATIASDWATNLTVHSGTSRVVNVKPVPPKPQLQNKIYVAFILSDGDNLQYIEHLMRKLWNNPDRGSVPIGWTLSPAMLDAMPGALNFYHQTATNNDNLISGPSGYGYSYPNNYPNQGSLDQFISKTEDYNRRAGFQVVTVWNTIVGGINQNVGQSFANNAPSLLGVTAQNTGGGLTIYNNSLPGMALSCNYCTNEQAMKDHIASAAAGWNRNEPRFIIIQAQPWTDVKPSNFKNVANSLNADYIVVRPDHIFQLIREAKGLPVNPNPVFSTGLVTAYKDCNYAGFSGGLNLGNYTTAQLNAIGIKDNDISSLKVTEGYKIIAYENDNFTGASIEYTADNNCVGVTWNDKISSVKILPNGATNVAGTYYLQNRNSGLYMDVVGGLGGTGDGVNIQQYNGTNANNQKFEFVHLGDGVYTIKAVHSGKVVDVAGGTTATQDGANIQQWTNLNGANQQFIVVPVTGGYYKLVAKHSGKIVEVIGASTAIEANVQQWANNNQTCGQWTLKPVQLPYNTGDGIRADYFNEQNFETWRVAKKENNINFDWGNGSPDAAVAVDNYSARWTGKIQPRYTGTYTFYINSDNGRRLWINNQLIIDKWLNDWNVEYTGTISLEAGKKYDIVMEYFEATGGASSKLEWSSASQTREVVPQGQLYANVAPTVSITSPVNNTNYVLSDPITVNTTAADNDGNISKVEFYNGTTKLGEDVTSPYSYTWTNAAIGTYTITARAIDNQGVFTNSSVITVKVNANQNPIVSLTSPVNNATYTAPASITVNAAASDADGTVTKVEFFNGTTKLGEDASSPYSYTWTNAAAGTYTLTAKATDDKNGTAASSAVTIIVNNPNQAPAIAITSPANNTNFVAPANVTINATATDTDGTISKVEFYNGTTLLGTINSSPYTYNWTNVVAGTYSITATAYDNSGLSATSAAVTVKVNANQIPTVTVSATSTSPNTVSISATATDGDGAIVKVEYYDGTTKIGESTSSPYTFIWTNAPVGTHNITAVATDNKGGKTTSSAVTVIVTDVNQAPVVSIVSPSGNATYIAPSDLILTANASDDGTISKVEFYSGADLIASLTSSPFTYTVSNAGVGVYIITAKAYDNLGLSSTSDPVKVNIIANQFPDITVSAAYAMPADVNITVTASDNDGTIVKVEFYAGIVKIGESTTAPYDFLWQNAPTGNHSITAIAIDNKGGKTTSSPVIVEVKDVSTFVNDYQSINFYMYPIPATSIINISGIDNSGILVIMNSIGEEVKSGNGNSISVEELASGLYYIVVYSNGQTIVKSFVKQ